MRRTLSAQSYDTKHKVGWEMLQAQRVDSAPTACTPPPKVLQCPAESVCSRWAKKQVPGSEQGRTSTEGNEGCLMIHVVGRVHFFYVKQNRTSSTILNGRKRGSEEERGALVHSKQSADAIDVDIALIAAACRHAYPFASPPCKASTLT